MSLFILSFIAFGISISSNWYAYEYYYEGSPLPHNLTDWWYTLSLWGTAANFMFLLLDCCCCCCDVKDKAVQEAMAMTSFFATLVIGDLPLLVLSLRSIYEISNNDQLCEGSDDVLFFFQLRIVISLIVSFFHLIKVCVLNVDDHECSRCLFCSYFWYFTLSILIVCPYARYVC